VGARARSASKRLWSPELFEDFVGPCYAVERLRQLACLEPLGLSVTEGAKVLGVTRQTLNNVIKGKSGISPEMAIRLSKAFGSTPETWLRMQLACDLAQARK
jgi:antitoxin HigA-1